MNAIFRVPLRDGADLEIYRFILKGKQTDLPDWVLPFAQYNLPACWGEYYADLWKGRHENCCDYLYIGRVGGIPCGRMWFGYSLRTGAGNFGNVLTLPEYRRRGIMKILLNRCVSDFYGSGALFCSCDAAASAAPAYAAAGFRRIFSETQPPMVIVSKRITDFAAIMEMAYGRTESAVVREGTVCDRFDCDKLLGYAPEVYGRIAQHPVFPGYLNLWGWSRKNHVPIYVLEAVSGFCAGYAVSCGDSPFIFLHPAFERYRDSMLCRIRTMTRVCKSSPPC